MNAAKRLEMNALALSDLAVVVKDNNGKYWGFGVDRAVSSSDGTGETGTAFDDANMYQIVLQSRDNTYAPTLSDSAISTLVGA